MTIMVTMTISGRVSIQDRWHRRWARYRSLRGTVEAVGGLLTTGAAKAEVAKTAATRAKLVNFIAMSRGVVERFGVEKVELER